MKLRFCTLMVAAAALVAIPFGSTASAADWGDLKVKFVFDGTPPEREKINVDKDAEVFGKLGLRDEELIVGEDGGIQNVVVYVRTRNVDVHPDYEKNAEKQVVLDNKGGRFTPRILPVWYTKQDVLLHNSDPVGHNSNVQPLGDKPANPLLPPNSGVVHKFSKAQLIPVPVGCNIHPWMKGYVLPRDNPYMAVSDEDGVVEIKNLPAGKEIEFQAWQEKSGYLAVPKWERGRFTVKIKPGENDLGTIKVPASLFKK